MSSFIPELSRQLRLVLESSPNALSLSELTLLVDEVVHECTSSSEPEFLIVDLEEELQAIYHDVIDHDVFEQTETFLSVLSRLTPVFSSTSLISTWFELVLRPALRQPKLPSTAVACAKDLVVTALEKPDEHNPEKQGEFRRRMLDLYLLDAFNEASGDDVLEWAKWPQEQRERRNVWKTNLEDVLVRFGLGMPQEFLTQVFHCFASPSSRFQLLNLLNNYTSQPQFENLAPIMIKHPMTQSILTHLLVDTSSTVCTIGLTIMTKLIPIFAVHDPENLKPMLPQLLAILARVICWRERVPSPGGPAQAFEVEEDILFSDVAVNRNTTSPTKPIGLNPDLGWDRLELTFGATASPPPSPRRFFTLLYYLFPCNLLDFLRRPADYLIEKGCESPYVVQWDDLLDYDQIKTKSEILLRAHATHPRIIWTNIDKELSDPDFFASRSVSQIVSECLLLVVRKTAAFQPTERGGGDVAERNPAASHDPTAAIPDTPEGETSGRFATRPPDGATTSSSPSDLPQVSLQHMVNTSIALKSRTPVEFVDPIPAWPYTLFHPPASRTSSGTATYHSAAASPTSLSVHLPDESQPVAGETSDKTEDNIPNHVAQAMASLQREVLLLKTELNFELWLTRQNVQQVLRLYENRIASSKAEEERQGLHNALRDYRTHNSDLQRQLKEHKESAAKAKSTYVEWNSDLQAKVTTLKKEKKTWQTETSTLRLAEKELRAQFTAQGKLLAEAEKRVFELETSIKENAHKVDRLKDYERRIEQLTLLQKLWDLDVHRNKEQKEVLKAMLSKYKKMELRIQTYEQTHAQMEEYARGSRRQIQALETKVALLQSQKQRRRSGPDVNAYTTKLAALTEENARIREMNQELKEETDELNAMVEVLKARQYEGNVMRSPMVTGLVLDTTRSPVSSVVGSPVL